MRANSLNNKNITDKSIVKTDVDEYKESNCEDLETYIATDVILIPRICKPLRVCILFENHLLFNI